MVLAEIVTLPNKPTHYMKNESIILYTLKAKTLTREHIYTKGRKTETLIEVEVIFNFLNKKCKLEALFSLKAQNPLKI